MPFSNQPIKAGLRRGWTQFSYEAAVIHHCDPLTPVRPSKVDPEVLLESSYIN